MKMKVTLDSKEVASILNEAVSKQVGQPMVIRNTWDVTDDIEFESKDVVEARMARRPEPITNDVPELTTEGTAAAQAVEEEVPLYGAAETATPATVAKPCGRHSVG